MLRTRNPDKPRKPAYWSHQEEEPLGPYHSFWLLKESEYKYRDSHSFLPRRDAPLRLDDELLHVFLDTLAWIPTINPNRADQRAGNGLNWDGASIIHHEGGAILQKIFLSWVQLFRLGPELLRLHGFCGYEWPFESEEHLLREDELPLLLSPTYLTIERDWLIEQLTQLADYGERVATGEYFLLHIGI